MTRRRGAASMLESPVLVGAITLLVAIVAVFLSYNANSGLPFVPTYDLKAEIPSGNKLVKGNEVRTGGFRVGVVEEILSVGEPDLEAQRQAEIDRIREGSQDGPQGPYGDPKPFLDYLMGNDE